jgi:hypothetical protein
LEAVLAMAILAGVLVAVLELRSRTLIDGERVAAAQRHHRLVDALFEQLVNGTLPTPERATAATGGDGPQQIQPVLVWSGVFAGHDYTIERRRSAHANPIVQQGLAEPTQLAASLGLFSYRITVAGRTTEMLWHR